MLESYRQLFPRILEMEPNRYKVKSMLNLFPKVPFEHYHMSQLFFLPYLVRLANESNLDRKYLLQVQEYYGKFLTPLLHLFRSTQLQYFLAIFLCLLMLSLNKESFQLI